MAVECEIRNALQSCISLLAALLLWRARLRNRTEQRRNDPCTRAFAIIHWLRLLWNAAEDDRIRRLQHIDGKCQ
jgi:hypothetical protein